MKHGKFQRLPLLGFIALILALTAFLSGCYYEDDYYGYGGGGPAYYGASQPYYADVPYSPSYRSTVYESPAPYYRTSPRYYSDNRYYYDNDYRYRNNSYYSGGGGGGRYYHRNYEDNNRYRKTAIYRRDYDSSKSPSEQRKKFVERAKDQGRYNQKAEDSVESDRKKEQSRDRKKKK